VKPHKHWDERGSSDLCEVFHEKSSDLSVEPMVLQIEVLVLHAEVLVLHAEVLVLCIIILTLAWYSVNAFHKLVDHLSIYLVTLAYP